MYGGDPGSFVCKTLDIRCSVLKPRTITTNSSNLPRVPWMHEGSLMPCLDVMTSRSPFRNYFAAPRAQLLFHGRTSYRITPWTENWLGFVANGKAVVIRNRRIPAIRAIATMERSVSVDQHESSSTLAPGVPQHESSSGIRLSEDEVELEERERMRRLRISKANKGNVPWNKGRKHRPETLQRIRERTRIAMQDPKIRMKLVNIRHAQTEETRVKIGIGVREGWQRRREKLLVQETCCFEWQNAIAEVSRKGFVGEEELQWNSYDVLDEQLEEEWQVSIEKRKNRPKPKGSKRAPKSLEQRRKISEAISAKWADPDYRDRVRSALSKYHGFAVGTGKSRRKVPDGTERREKVERKKPSRLENIKFELQVLKKVVPKSKKNTGPTYKDPMAKKKLEMIKKIREQRSEMESRKREATERAKLLISEAENAAKALEMAALTNPLVRASLLESRKLIAEAMRSIEDIEKGEVTAKDGGRNINFVTQAEASLGDSQPGPEEPTDTMPEIRNEQPINGHCQHPSIEKPWDSFYLDGSVFADGLNGRSSLAAAENLETTVDLNQHSSMVLPIQDHACNEMSPTINGNSTDQKAKVNEEIFAKASKEGDVAADTAKTKKKWIRGRFIEVEDA